MAKVTLTGLNPKQKALCEIMWSMDSKDQVESFIATLPKADARTAQSLLELIILEFTDSVESVDEANKELDKYRL